MWNLRCIFILNVEILAHISMGIQDASNSKVKGLQLQISRLQSDQNVTLHQDGWGFISPVLSLSSIMATAVHHHNHNHNHHQQNSYFIRPRSTRILTIRCKKPNNSDAFNERKRVHVDYGKGICEVSTHISGLRKSDLPKRHRLRVEGDRFQKDWTISEVVERILELNHWDDVEAVLNRWAGRFARKNFPVLIKVILQLL